jgi:hypothetical protein
MFGIPVQGTLTVFCDNEAVYKNDSFSELTLKKKHNSICFHWVWECAAVGIITVHKVDSKFNLSSDVLTNKSLSGLLQKSIREWIMFIPNNWFMTMWFRSPWGEWQTLTFKYKAVTDVRLIDKLQYD